MGEGGGRGQNGSRGWRERRDRKVAGDREGKRGNRKVAGGQEGEGRLKVAGRRGEGAER